MRIAAPVLALLAVSGCLERTGFVCESDQQCAFNGETGTCSGAGYCAFPDPGCSSGLRYGDEAPPDLAGICLRDSSPADAGEPRDVATGAGADAGVDTDGDAAQLADYDPSNFDADLLTAGEAALLLSASDGLVDIDTDLGTITRTSDGASLLSPGVTFSQVVQADAPSIGVFSAASLTVEEGVTIRVKGSAALAFAIAGDADVSGAVEINGGAGMVHAAGAGGFAGGRVGSPDGEGPGGADAENGSGDVGGAGGGHLVAGGDGGDRAGLEGASGGPAYGGPELVPLLGGSGGSAGGGGGTRGPGGGGGGALQISARGVVRVSGSLSAAGAGGGGGGNDDGGGGGGSGGAILLEGDRVEVSGVLACNGGGGGAGADETTTGADGESGPAAVARAAGGSGAGEGRSGGDGGGGATPAGGPGAAAAGTPSDDNAGGGGGAAGRIRLRANAIDREGPVSPAAGLSETTPL